MAVSATYPSVGPGAFQGGWKVVGIEGKLAKPVTEIIEHIVQKVPKGLGHGHHRIAGHVHQAADHFDKVEQDLADKAHHEHRSPGHTPHAGGVPATAGRTPGARAGERAAADAAENARRNGMRPGDPAREGRPGSGKKCVGDPMDVATGDVLVPQTDLELPGVLPLVLERTHISSYRDGQWFGRSWASTVDQRLQLDSEGIVFASADGMRLVYPVPRAGADNLPVAGPRLPLTWNGQPNTPMRINDPGTGQTLVFGHPRPQPGADGAVVLRISAIEDRNGNRIDISWADDDTPALISHHGGYRVAVDCDAALRRVTGLRLMHDDGTFTTVRRFGYDKAGNLAEVVNSSGLPLRFRYDARSRVTGWTDRAGHTYTYAYDDAGRVVEASGTGGYLSATLAYDEAGHTTSVTDSLGRTTVYRHNDAYLLLSRTDPLGHTLRQAYDERGRLVSVTDELGRTTGYTLDEFGDPVRIEEPDGSVTALAYNGFRQLTSWRRGARVRGTYTYDDRGNLLTSTDAVGAVTAQTYDDHGRLTSVTDALGHIRRVATNEAGLITAVTDPDGGTAGAAYDAFGRPATTTDRSGSTTHWSWRAEGEVTARVLPDGGQETWTYDADGRLVEYRDRAGGITHQRSGPFGLLLARTFPDGQRQEFGYDTEQNLLKVAAGDAVWEYRYDEAGRVIGETDPNGRALVFRLDAAGQVVESVDAQGRVTAFAYDASGELVERVHHDGTATVLTYDEHGFVAQVAAHGSTIAYVRDAAGRVLRETVDGRTTSYDYDVLGRRTRRTTPTGIVSTWTYDAAGRPVGLDGTAGGLAFGYDAAGRETERRLGSGARLLSGRDGLGRLTELTLRAARGRPLLTRTYGYRADGVPAWSSDGLRGRRTYETTAEGRVTRVTGEDFSESYAYDALGNVVRAQDTRDRQHETAGARAYDGSLLRRAGRTSYTYDDQGRLTRRLVRTLSGQRREWRYAWDAESQLTQVTTPDGERWQYSYDPFGRRSAKWRALDGDAAPAGSEAAVREAVVFCWEGTQLIEQYEVLPDGTNRTLTWDWEPQAWQPVAQTERTWRKPVTDDRREVEGDGTAGSNRSWDERFYAIVTGLAGTPSELLAPDGQIAWTGDSDLWGRRYGATARAGGAPSCPLGRPGQYQDGESGLEYNYFRYYDPATGRYIAGDPLGLEAGPNPHAYVPNPLLWIDPLGLRTDDGQPEGWGGSHYSLRPSNWTKGPLAGQKFERNHTPARDSYVKIGGHKLGYGPAPAIRMEYDDHRDFISTGSGADSDAWRRKQEALIRQGKFDVAMKMDIGMIRKIHGTKYDAAIKEMVDSLPHNKSFQDYLTAHGWKIRYCLLQ